MIIRDATLRDLTDITEIYNEAILNTVATFDTNIKTLHEQRSWFNKHGSKNPIIVAEDNGKVVGWASLSKYSDRCAYSDTAELSLYVRKEFQGKGIGKNLMKEIVKKGKQAGLHAIISRIAEGNQVSVHLHKTVGFEHVGIYKEVGYKFGKRLDVYLMEKLYNK
ncbi:MAG: N-acetyltransferase [Candidatus Thermoplasmatota archaeon]|nr:N-acetyltransferase [Candidatus Thermoplasmatota archaeon]